MGKLVVKETDTIIEYTVFSKNAFGKILELGDKFPQYTFMQEDKYKSEDVFYDSQENILSTAGLIICKQVEGTSASVIIEKESYVKKIDAVSRPEQIYVHPIVPRDKISDHMFFLIEGISSLITTQFHVDLEHVLKTAVPKIGIYAKNTLYKIYGGMGFKAEMEFKSVEFKNFETKRKAKSLMIKIRNISGERFSKDFKDFIAELEKNVKEIIEVKDSTYKIARRMTRPILPEDIERAKAKKKDKKD